MYLTEPRSSLILYGLNKTDVKNKKYLVLSGIMGALLLFFLVKGFLEHIRFHKQDYKSAEHVYAGKYCVVTIPENWKDSLPQLPGPGAFIHLQSGSEEASMDISINNNVKDTIADMATFEEAFHQRLLEKYTKTWFSQLGNYQGRGLLMTGKMQNKPEGYVKIFMHIDSVQSFFILECNTAPHSKQMVDDLQELESSFRLK